MLVVVVPDERTDSQRLGGRGRRHQRRNRRQLVVEVVGHRQRAVAERFDRAGERDPDAASAAVDACTPNRNGRDGVIATQTTGCRRSAIGLATSLEPRVRLIAWLLRLGAIIVAGALLTTAVRGRCRPAAVASRQRPRRTAGVAAGVPAVVAAQLRLRRRRQRDRRVRAREQPADHAGAGSSARCSSAFLAVEDEQFYVHHGVNLRSFARAMLVELLQRRAATRRQHDHPAGGQERVPRRSAPRRALQGSAGALRDDAREEDEQGRDPRALPQHGVLRQQRLRVAGRGGGLLRQERRRADDDRGGVPRRSRPIAVGFRPDPPFANAPRARFRQVTETTQPMSAWSTPLVGSLLGSTWKMPEQVRTIPTYATTADLLHRGDQGVPAEPGDLPRRRAGARQPAVPRRPADPHDVRPEPAGAGRTGAHEVLPKTTGRHRRRHRRRSTPRRVRSGRWSAAAGSSRASTRSTWHWCPARRDRASSSSSSLRLCRPARSRTT